MLSRETVDMITEWRRATFPDQDHYGAMRKVGEEFDEFDVATETGIEELDEFVDLLITLTNYADIRGWIDVLEERTTAKMSDNIDRTWHVREDGSGQHVEGE